MGVVSMRKGCGGGPPRSSEVWEVPAEVRRLATEGDALTGLDAILASDPGRCPGLTKVGPTGLQAFCKSLVWYLGHGGRHDRPPGRLAEAAIAARRSAPTLRLQPGHRRPTMAVALGAGDACARISHSDDCDAFAARQAFDGQISAL